MIFRIFFVFFICFLSIFWIYSLFRDGTNLAESEQIHSKYSSLLSDALTRNNNWKNDTISEVIFMREDYVSWENWSQQKKPVLPNNMISYDYNSRNKENNNSFDRDSWDNDENNNKWNFGTPKITSSEYTQVNENCAWIFFDPCIVIQLKAEAWERMFLGKTPIYDDPSQLSS